MISVISPAKKLNFNADSPIKAFSQCDFLDESKKLVDEAKDYSFDDIMKLMRVSENIANLTVQRFQEWKLPFDDQNAKQAALAFTGDTYAGLEADTFSQDDFDYSQEQQNTSLDRDSPIHCFQLFPMFYNPQLVL